MKGSLGRDRKEGVQDQCVTRELTTLYVLIDDHVVPPRAGRGRRPELIDSELITIQDGQVLLADKGFTGEEVKRLTDATGLRLTRPDRSPRKASGCSITLSMNASGCSGCPGEPSRRTTPVGRIGHGPSLGLTCFGGNL